MAFKITFHFDYKVPFTSSRTRGNLFSFCWKLNQKQNPYDLMKKAGKNPRESQRTA